MNSPVEILMELKEISPLVAGIEKRNFFSVPAGYFLSLSETLRSAINTDPELSVKINNFSVPVNYFENLSSSILDKIRQANVAEELRTLSPDLSESNQNVFNVPEGYFEDLSDEIIRKIQPVTKVIPIKRDPVWKYAAAAVMTGIIGLSSLTMFNKKQQPENVPVNESGISTYVQAASEYKNDEQINKGMSQLSDEEIIKYLESTSNETDNESLTSNIEENELPAQKDYLQNEKTLDTYLNGKKDP